MPTYDFACDYGHTVEVFQSMTAPGEMPCPQCQEEGHEDGVLRKRIGPGAGVLWKGGSPTPKFAGRRR